MKKTTCSKKCY